MMDRREKITWFLIGFQRCWTVQQFAEATGTGMDTIKDEFKFIPLYAFKTTQIRAIVANISSKLFDRLDAGLKSQDAINKAIDYLETVQAPANLAGGISTADRSAFQRDRRKNRAAAMSQAAWRDFKEKGSHHKRGKAAT